MSAPSRRCGMARMLPPTMAEATTSSYCGNRWRSAAKTSPRTATPKCWRACWRATVRRRSIAAKACGPSPAMTNPPARCCWHAIGSAKSRFMSTVPRTGSISARSRNSFLPCSGGVCRSMPTSCAATSSTATNRSTRAETRFLQRSARSRQVARSRSTTRAAAEERYWQPVVGDVQPAMTYDEAVAGARAALIRSVDLRLRADVPIAFCLSGGIDSNALISIAKRYLDYPVHGFTIMNSDSRYEERDMVEASVQELGLCHTEVPVEKGHFLPHLARLVAQHDAPVYTITYYAQWRLMQAVHEAGYKVSVSGTGADELFTGYYDHHNAYLSMLQSEPALYAEALANWRRDIAPIVRNPFLRDPEYLVRRPEARDHIYLNAEEFAAYLRQDWSEPFAEEAYSDDLLRNRMVNELFHESVPPILHEDDLNAMYFSIENRSPFLDRGLFEWCQSIPTRHLIRDGRAKSV